jgi:tetratricopeptide (TPR) repeat protein
MEKHPASINKLIAERLKKMDFTADFKLLRTFYRKASICALTSMIVLAIFLLFAGESQALDGLKKFKNFEEVIRVLRQEPNNLDALTAKAIQMAGLPEAQKTIAQIQKLNPNYEAVYAAILWDNVVRNDIQGLEEIINQANKRTFKEAYLDGYFFVGKTYLDLSTAKTIDRLKAASANVEYAIQLSNNDTKIMINVGQLLLDYGLVGESIPVFERALEIDPKSTRTLYMKSIALSRFGKPSEAVKYADMVIELNPKDSLGYQAKGYALNFLGNYAESIKANQMAVKLSPDFAIAWSQLGLAQEKSRKSKDAARSYKKAIAVDLKKAANWYNYLHWGLTAHGQALLGLGKIREALNFFDEALNINPRYEEALISKSLILGKQGKLPSLVNIINDVQSLNPRSPYLNLSM